MRKNFPLFFLIICLVLGVLAAPALGANAEWELQWREDGTLVETVTIPSRLDDTAMEGWESRPQAAHTVWKREIKSWEQYQQLTDRLPLVAETQNLIFFRTTYFKVSEYQPTEGVYTLIRKFPNVGVLVEVPGTIEQSQGALTGENTARWEMDELLQQGNVETVLQVFVLDGFLVGLVLFLLGFLAVLVFYITRVRRVRTLIEEEYSMEKAEEEFRAAEEEPDTNPEGGGPTPEE